MLIDWLKTNAWKASTFAASIALIAVYALDKFVIDRLVETRVVRIRIFDRIVKVPNSYMFDGVIIDEVRLTSQNGKILMGRITPNKKKFVDYVHKQQVRIRNECGVKFVFSKIENSEFALLSNASEFMFITNPDKRLIANIRNDICGTN